MWLDKDWKTMASRQPRRRGFSLSELMFALGITAIMAAAICAIAVYSSYNFRAFFHYVDLDDVNRLAMDQLTSDIRQAHGVWSASTNSLVLSSPNMQNGALTNRITYSYSTSVRTLTRTETDAAGAVLNSRVLLRGCDAWKYNLGQRNLTPGGTPYEGLPITSSQSTIRDTAKVIDVSWLCSRAVFGTKSATESVQTARVVIRKQAI
jgi:prepilin-type N-terminal cleavage/methylation domain-containing protein